jgi:hypothetical protein
MTDEPQPIPGNDEAYPMHNAEQMWAQADEHLGKVIEYAESVMPIAYANAGGNQDISVVYDWWKSYIQIAEHMSGEAAHSMTILMCSAALTRLMRNDDRMRADTVLAQLEKEISNDDDH